MYHRLAIAAAMLAWVETGECAQQQQQQQQQTQQRRPDEAARREQVMQWAAKADRTACEALDTALTDPSADIRGRAASALYWKCDRSAAGHRAAKALCRSVEMGNANAGALLLLGYAATAQDSIPCLQRPFPKGARVKLLTSTKPVSAQLAAGVALARLGDAKALGDLRSAFSDKTPLWDTLFLLAVLGDIRDREALNAAAGHLSDTRVCPGVVAHATRLVRDVALEALVSRLGIETPQFRVEPGKRYSDREIEEVRQSALARIRAMGS